MANRLQKIVYYFSSMTPIGITFSIVWFIQKKGLLLPVILLGISLISILIFLRSFRYAQNNIAPMTIRITEVSGSDTWIFGYLISYMLPLANMIIDEWNLYILVAIAVLIIVVAPFINYAIPHPLLFLERYHFYCVATENGLTYVLISKKIIRNKKDVKMVGRIFDFLLLEK